MSDQIGLAFARTETGIDVIVIDAGSGTRREVLRISYTPEQAAMVASGLLGAIKGWGAPKPSKTGDGQ